MWHQLQLFPTEKVSPASSDTTSTFIDNIRLPIHRWFRYAAGFSAEWVKETIKDTVKHPGAVLLDPFAGSGTTILAGQEKGLVSIGIEAHPFVARVARTKLLWHQGADDFRIFAERVLRKAERQGGTSEGYGTLVHKCFPDGALRDLDALRRAWTEESDGGPSSELTWLALTSILRICSPVGTSQMELIQPKKRKQKFRQPFEAYEAQTTLMVQDMSLLRSNSRPATAFFWEGDARLCQEVKDQSIDVVITSPPYANNFDYADATRLEMTFWGQVDGWGDLHDKVRSRLIRACSQHMSAEDKNLESWLQHETLEPIVGELRRVCERLAAERALHGGQKNYHLMVAAYFFDMAHVWRTLRRVCKRGSSVCFVIGDSAPYGIYVPVHDFLGNLAVAAGFTSFHFERTRDRNVKWKNRKHKVPLCEGRLWVKG